MRAYERKAKRGSRADAELFIVVVEVVEVKPSARQHGKVNRNWRSLALVLVAPSVALSTSQVNMSHTLPNGLAPPPPDARFKPQQRRVPTPAPAPVPALPPPPPSTIDIVS
jgi:hypothetical protein